MIMSEQVLIDVAAMDDSHKMGFLGASSYVIGNIIGSGIFITPASILRCTDSVGLSIIVWVACALIAILAFAFMWVSVLMTYPATIAICAETFGQYVVEGLQQAYDIDPAWAPTCRRLFGFSLLMLVTWMNFFSLSKFAARFQIVATVAKLGSCFVIIVTGMYYYFVKGWDFNLRDPMKGSNYGMGNLVIGFYGGLWAYSGWDVLNYGAGEIRNPKRNVPLALLSGIAVVTGTYVAINLAYFVVLDVETFKSSNAVAALFAQATLGPFAYCIPFLIGILLLGSVNSNLFSGSRYMYAAARQGHLPACFSCVNQENDSPRVAVFAQSVLAVAISFVGDLDALIGYVMFGFWAQRIFTLVALLIIRHKKIPVHPDAVRVPLFCIYLFLGITIALVVIPVFLEFKVTAMGLAICAVGFVFYYVFVLNDTLPKCAYRWSDMCTFMSCIVFDCLPDLKPGVGTLGTSDSSQALLLTRRTSACRLSDDSVPDLHSDEKNTMRRIGSNTGLRFVDLPERQKFAK